MKSPHSMSIPAYNPTRRMVRLVRYRILTHLKDNLARLSRCVCIIMGELNINNSPAVRRYIALYRVAWLVLADWLAYLVAPSVSEVLVH